MKDIFADLYNRVLSFFNKTDNKTENAKDVACNRLKLVLMQDRTNLTPATMDRMRKELIDLLSKYLELDRELLDLSFEHEDEQMALMLSIPVIRAKSEEEIQAILDAEGVNDSDSNDNTDDDNEGVNDDIESDDDEDDDEGENDDIESDDDEGDDEGENDDIESDDDEDDDEGENDDIESDDDDVDEDDGADDVDEDENPSNNEEKKEKFFKEKKRKK